MAVEEPRTDVDADHAVCEHVGHPPLVKHRTIDGVDEVKNTNGYAQ